MLQVGKLPRSVELVRTGSGAACLRYIDERLLPADLVIAETESWLQVIDAIKTLAVRGAPAIGAAGAAAVALWACNVGCAQANEHGCMEAPLQFMAELREAAQQIAEARPTAVNLEWGVRRMVHVAEEALGAVCSQGVFADSFVADDADDVDLACKVPSLAQVADMLFDEVKRIEAEDEAANRAMGAHGASLLPENACVLTHCNAGSLATVFYGTALGVIYAAAEQGKIQRVYADETRPVGQGARLTAWELSQAGVPVTLICDNMAASLMAQGCVDAVIVGADRIAANGDAANKIGTYGVAVLAKHHGIPFYVAAPSSTFDPKLETGAQIPIEQRAATEVAQPIPGVDVWNPAFDVTPASLITRIITERGAFLPEEACAATLA